ncbi:MAG: hypothetical protein SNJ78_02130 [Spirochaetales bacterium]
MIKKSSKITLLSVILVTAFVLPLVAQTTGNLVLTGTVPPILQITVTALPAASNLDLSTTATVSVATVLERSNKKGGYTVTVTSANAVAASAALPFFKSADPANSDILAYSLTYGGAAVTFVSGSALVTDSNARTTGAGASKAVEISYTGDFLYEDTYSDTLTFTITAK